MKSKVSPSLSPLQRPGRALRACLLASFGLLTLMAQGAASQDLAAAYRDALAVKFPEPPTLQAHAAIGALVSRPDSLSDWATLQRAAEGRLFSEGEAPVVEVLLALEQAAEGHLEAYRERVAAVKAATTNVTLRKAADVSDLLDLCAACGGKPGCTQCRGSLKCPTCKGRGTVAAKRSTTKSTFSLDSSSRPLKCSACRGTGKCPACKGSPKPCATCNNSGKMPNVPRVHERIVGLAGKLYERLNETWKADLQAREQTGLMAEDLRKAQALPDPEEALAFLAALPPERVHAAQWAHVGTLRTLLEAQVAERTQADAGKQTARAELRAAIARAQRAETPLRGMAELIEAFETFATCDALPEAQTAFEGLFQSAKQQQRTRQEALEERLEAIGRLRSPEDVVAQTEACLADLPAWNPPATLKQYAASAGRQDLKAFLETDAFANLRERLGKLRDKALVQGQSGPGRRSWRAWALGALGGLILLYGAYAAITGTLSARAERARVAKQRAALENIRNTMARRRH